MSPLTEAERRLLLRLAGQAIEQAVRLQRPSREYSRPESALPSSSSLLSASGVFVTLYAFGDLRGCMGAITTDKPLYEAVQDCAVSAALFDPRFSSVRPEELPELHLGISVLSPVEPIAPEQIEIGQHGLLISRGERRGLLLPQVAAEHNWNRERFLEETCAKAGLPRDAWRSDATIQGFTAQVFSEQTEEVRAL